MVSPNGGFAHVETPARARRSLIDRRKRGGIGIARTPRTRAVATIRDQGSMAMTKVIIAPRFAPQGVARLDQCDQIASEPTLRCVRAQSCRCKPWLRARPQPAP